ncbi:F-box/kelch-repeat protein At1g57790-like [Quercus suber]|uniref:F-box/kelch-repeat protein At1g57790-like n=1 Tax=Quercus suber TaxID=58331 RepID=UPI0032DEBAB8
MEEQGSGKAHEKVNYLEDVDDTIDTEEYLPHLPFDIVKLIAERFFLVDYLICTFATCKTLHSASPPIQWRIEAQRLENPALSPWLVLFWKESGYSFVDPKHGDKYHVNLPQAIKESSIVCSSKDDWLLVTVDLSTSFFNPFTQAILPLPDFFGIRNSCMGFSSTPSSSECVVVEIEQSCNKPKFVVRFCSPGMNIGMSVKVMIQTLFDCNSPVFSKEAFYFLGRVVNLGILKLKGEEPSFEVLSKPKPPCNGNLQKFLVECNGELLSVFVAPFGKWVRVFKLNESKMTWNWIRVENLGNYMLYVSRSSSLSQ